MHLLWQEGKRAAALAEEEGYPVTAQVIMGYTPTYKPIASPIKYLQDQLYKKEDSTVLDRLGKAIGGIFAGGKSEGNVATDGTAGDGKGIFHRWWDRFVSWAESLFDGKTTADKAAIAKGWEEGNSKSSVHPDEVQDFAPDGP